MSSKTSKQGAIDVAAILDGDRKAFEVLVRQESPRLFRVLMRLLKDQDEAQSVMQETFLQAYKGLDTFRGEAKLTSWIYAIGINQARAVLRKRRRLNTMEEQDIERLQPEFKKGMYAQLYEPWDPSQAAALEQRKQLVHDAIERLPEPYRTVITLRDIEELSTDEVAQILEISNGAVRVRLHRARQALRALLAPYFGKDS